jgi:tetratricopeptide (TPR) repeat protein/S1-C subfamily serine protease
MKISIFSRLTIVGLTAAIAFSYSFIPSSQVKAFEKRSFGCEKTTKQDLPKTFTSYEQQKRILIRWAGALGGKTPQERCEQASLNLQQAYDNETLTFITNGIMRKKSVICTADDYGGDCVNLLITLNHQEDSLKVLNQLKEALLGKQKGPVIHTSDTPQIYYEIDLEKAIENAPVEQISQTVISQASSEGNNTPKYTGIVKQVDDIAEKITVRIDVTDGKNGSGVIIGKQGNTYYIATACHVVSLPRSGLKCTTEKLLDSFTLTTPDGEKHTLTSAPNQIIIINPDFDVAVIKFTSDKIYQVAELGDYQLEDKQWLFLSGFPGQDSNKQRRLTAGNVRDKDNSAFVSKEQSSFTNGNELLYSNLSFGGMSGGAILDTQGRVVGINTASEDESLEISDSNSKVISLGYSLGIPMMTFWGLTSQGKVPVESLKIISTSTKEINDAESQQIKDQLFIFEQLSKDSNALDWLNYGNQLWRASRLEESFTAFDQAIQKLEKEGKKKTLAKAYYAKGLALAYGDKNKEALDAFKQATVNENEFYQAWRYQGFILEILQQYNQALVAYQQAIDNSDKKNFTLYVEHGDILQRLSHYQKALASYQQAINLKPQHPWAYNNRGNLYFNQKEWELALSDFNQAIALNPKFVTAYNNRGLLHTNQEKWELAISDFNQALTLNSKYANAYHNRGLVYFNQKEWELAISDFKQAIALNAKFVTAYNNRGLVYFNQEKLDLAISDYNQALALNSQFTEAYNNRGNLYFKQKKLDLALADYNQAISINPQDAQTYYNRGNLYYEQEKWELALSDFNQAIALNPKYALAYNNRGNLYYEQEKWELALSDFNQAIALNPKYALAYNNRGSLYYEQEKWELALSDFNQAIALNPQDAEAYYKRGNLYFNQKEWELALSDFNQAIALNPQDAQAYNNRGLVYIEMDNKQAAIDDLQKAAQLYQKQDDTEGYKRVMEVLQQLKN